jgi:hypothetical protein
MRVRFVAQKQHSVFQGCQFKDHVPVLDSPRDSEVHTLFVKHRNLITLQPPKPQLSEGVTRLVSIRGKTAQVFET